MEGIEELVDTVHVDGLAILKIMNHCHQGLRTMVAGSLLDMSNNRMQEVTNCFPFPSREIDEETGQELGDAGDAVGYQMEMMKMLREVNVDYNCVGWYQSTYLGTYSNAMFIETQFNHQDTIGNNAVVLVYDPLQTTRGNLSIKAFRFDAVIHGQFQKTVRQRQGNHCSFCGRVSFQYPGRGPD